MNISDTGRSIAIAVGISVIIFAVLFGTDSVGAYSESLSEHAAKVYLEKKSADEAAAWQVKVDECKEELEPAIEALDEIEARIAVGINQADYGRTVQDAAYEIRSIDTDELIEPCQDIVMDMEQALIHYTKANTMWNDCIVNWWCDMDSAFDYKLNSHWMDAEPYYQSAKDAYEELDLTNPESEML